MVEAATAEHWREPLRFLVVGVLNTAFGYLVFATLILAGAGAGGALIGSTVAGAAFNFQSLRRLVFRRRGRWGQFLVQYAVLLLINWQALRLAPALGMSEFQMQALLCLPIATLSFVCLKLFVFRQADGGEGAKLP